MLKNDNKKLIVANWKMHKTFATAEEFMEKLQKLDIKSLNSSDLVISPAFPFIDLIVKHCKNLSIKVASQDCSAFSSNEGAFTGDVSANMLKDLGCEYVILGHSERRKYHHETNDFIKKKLINAHNADLAAIICIGETLEQRQAGDYKQYLIDTLEACLPDSINNHNIIIAYEPIWAIGTGQTATIDQIAEIHQYLSEQMLSRFALTPKIIYGGSVNLDNAQTILTIKYVDGLLIGGASLNPEILYQIAAR